MKKWIFGLIGLVVLVLADNAYAAPVPEMDAGSAVTALGVLTGVVALAAERFRRK